MAYVLRFVQRFRAQDEAAFMALEAQFEALERRKGWPRGRRSRPFAAREPVHSLVWDCELRDARGREPGGRGDGGTTPTTGAC